MERAGRVRSRARRRATRRCKRTFDLLVPDDSALAAYVIDDDRRTVHASIIAVKSGGDIVRAATHRAIADLVPEASLARDLGQGVSPRARGGGAAVRAAEPRAVRERATVIDVLTGRAISWRARSTPGAS